MLFTVLLTAIAFAAQAAPLPQLALDRFPDAARVPLTRAHGAAAARPDDAEAVGALGRLLHAWEQWQAAHQAYSRAQALSPRTFDWKYLDAVVLQRLARHTEAAALLKDAVSINPAYLPARTRLAEALLEAGEVAQSRALFESLLKEPAAQPAAHLGLGRLEALAGNHGAAIEHFEAAITLFPEFGTAFYALARAYRAVGRAEDAQRALEQHARYGARWPGLDDPVSAVVAGLREDPRAMLAKGIASASAGDVAAAVALHEAALQRDPTLVHAHGNLLSLYGRLGDYTKAEAHYRAALAANFENADLHYDVGVVFGMQEKWSEAEDAYRRAIAINSLHANARNNLGQLLERRREFGEAASQYREAVAAQPSFRLGRFNYGRMLIALGRSDEAIAELAQLQQPVDAETPRYLFALSAAHVRGGRIAEGRERATEAHRLALQFGQTDLAEAIARELSRLK